MFSPHPASNCCDWHITPEPLVPDRNHSVLAGDVGTRRDVKQQAVMSSNSSADQAMDQNANDIMNNCFVVE
jgi:hypothetical protein